MSFCLTSASDEVIKPLRVQNYNKKMIYARGNEKLPQICAKNDQI